MRGAGERLVDEVRETRVVYLIDDDSDLRKSMHFLLTTHDICISPYASGLSFLSDLSSLPPAPIILDVRMPDMDGMRVLHQIRHEKVCWPVVMLTGHGDVRVAVEALKAGAVDFLEKPVDATTLLNTLAAAFEVLNAKLAEDRSGMEAAARIAKLTPREVQVLAHLRRGRSNKQVAFELSISPRTVEMHRANALRQLDVRSLVEALAVFGGAGDASAVSSF